jgi:ElaB/YqjD/DUF883 family membrane-anchored ribosome-binding protein
MAEVIGWIEKLQGLGIGGLSLLFLYLTTKYFIAQAEAREKTDKAERSQIRTDFQTVIDAKDGVITNLSDQLRDAAVQSRTDMERHLERQVESTRRTEEIIAANTAAVAALQDLVRAIPRGGNG